MNIPNKIEQVSVETLIPYARNSRTHSDAQVAQIAASIKEFGFTNPVLIDGGGDHCRTWASTCRKEAGHSKRALHPLGPSHRNPETRLRYCRQPPCAECRMG